MIKIDVNQDATLGVQKKVMVPKDNVKNTF